MPISCIVGFATQILVFEMSPKSIFVLPVRIIGRRQIQARVGLLRAPAPISEVGRDTPIIGIFFEPRRSVSRRIRYGIEAVTAVSLTIAIGT